MSQAPRLQYPNRLPTSWPNCPDFKINDLTQLLNVVEVYDVFLASTPTTSSDYRTAVNDDIWAAGHRYAKSDLQAAVYLHMRRNREEWKELWPTIDSFYAAAKAVLNASSQGRKDVRNEL